MSGSGISWAICKSAPCSRQITTPAPHHSAAQPTASKHWSRTKTFFISPTPHHCYQVSWYDAKVNGEWISSGRPVLLATKIHTTPIIPSVHRWMKKGWSHGWGQYFEFRFQCYDTTYSQRFYSGPSEWGKPRENVEEINNDGQQLLKNVNEVRYRSSYCFHPCYLCGSGPLKWISL